MTGTEGTRRSAITEDNNWTQPNVVSTRLGPVEYSEYGQGPVIVALHGAMGGYDQSRILAQTIGGEGFRYLAVSRPGYLGTPLRSGESPEAQARLIAALLDALSIKSACIMAISGGGPAALFFGHQFPLRCSGLVLVSTCATTTDTPIPFSFKVMQFLARSPSIAKRVGDKMTSDLNAVARRSISDPKLLEQTFADQEIAPLFKAMLRSTADRMNKRLVGTKNDIRISRHYDYPLEALDLPVLVVHGKCDQHVPFSSHAVVFQNRLKRCTLLAVENGEHVAIFTHRRIVQQAAMDFLKEINRGQNTELKARAKIVSPKPGI